MLHFAGKWFRIFFYPMTRLTTLTIKPVLFVNRLEYSAFSRRFSPWQYTLKEAFVALPFPSERWSGDQLLWYGDTHLPMGLTLEPRWSWSFVMDQQLIISLSSACHQLHRFCRQGTWHAMAPNVGLPLDPGRMPSWIGPRGPAGALGMVRSRDDGEISSFRSTISKEKASYLVGWSMGRLIGCC